MPLSNIKTSILSQHRAHLKIKVHDHSCNIFHLLCGVYVLRNSCFKFNFYEKPC